jgi:predicted AlkP superfamily pyrophosphatase or phosphodiesterase
MLRPVVRFLGLAAFCVAPLFAANKDRHVILVSLDGFPAYLWRDESIPLPNLRKLAAEGAVTNAMTISNPAITWPNHTSLVTGVPPAKHGVLYNGLVVRGGPGKPNKIEPWVDREKLVLVPTVYDAVFNAGMTTAEVDWVAVTRPKTITWSFAELVDPDAALPREMVAAGVATRAELETAKSNRPNIVWRDEIWTRAACFLVTQHQPNLLMYHTLNTDATHHRYGPGSPPSISALALADHLVGQLVRAVDASGRRAQTTIIVTTDHGFKKVDKYVYANVALKKAGLLHAAGPTVTECDAFVGSQGGIGLVYITDPARRAELLPKLMEIFRHTEGVADVIDAATGAAALGMPTPEANQGMGDIIIYPKTGYAFSGAAAGDAITGPATNYGGTHGYNSADPELDGIFLASGAGIKKGVRLERMRNIDVAPTIARLLDVPLPNVDGQVLESILETRK